MPEATVIREAIGRRLRQHRADTGALQEDVARVMRERFGLDWSQSTVTAVETGRRDVSLEEFVALLGATGIPAPEWFPGRGRIRIGDDPPARISRSGLRAYLSGGDGRESWDMPMTRREAMQADAARLAKLIADRPDLEERLRRHLEETVTRSRGFEVADYDIADPRTALLDAEREAEGKAARTLNRRHGERLPRRLDAIDVALLAHRTWGRGLTDERERRLRRDLEGDESARQRQAKRGHVTRALLAELEERYLTPVEPPELTPEEQQAIASSERARALNEASEPTRTDRTEGSD